MESFAIYLIKVNIALIVLYAFYKLSFSKDTFFRLRRIMLLLICVTSLIYPLIDFSGWTDEYAIGETFTTVYNKLLPASRTIQTMHVHNKQSLLRQKVNNIINRSCKHFSVLSCANVYFADFAVVTCIGSYNDPDWPIIPV